MNLKDLFPWLWRRDLSSLPYVATKCGHRTEQEGRVSAFEHVIIIEMPRNEIGSVDYCLDCIGKMAIQCAWCGNQIFIGDPITLYTPRCNFKVPEHAVVYAKKPLQLVGCLDGNCAESRADKAGLWLPDENGKGHVHRVPTAHEEILGHTKKPVNGGWMT